MNDAAPPRMPPAPPANAGEPAIGLRSGEQALRVLSLHGEVQAQRQAIRLEGIIRRISEDRTTAIIETEKGEVEIRLRPRTVLEEGQRVEIDLPEGARTRQAILRPTTDNAPDNAPNTANGGAGGNHSGNKTGIEPSHSGNIQQDSGTSSRVSPEASSAPSSHHPAGPTLPPHTSLPPRIREMIDIVATPRNIDPHRLATLKPDMIIRLLPMAMLPQQAELLPPAPPLAATLPPLTLQNTIMREAAHPPAPLAPASLQNLQTLSSSTPPALSGPSFATALPDIQATSSATMAASAITATTETAAAGIGTTTMTAIPAMTIHLPLQEQIFPFIIPVRPQQGTAPSGTIDMRVMAIRPDTVPSTISSPLSGSLSGSGGGAEGHGSPWTLKGEVVATTSQNFPVLSLLWPGEESANIFLLQFPAANLPVGAEIELQQHWMTQSITPTPATQNNTAFSTLPSPAAGLMQGWDWPVFDDMLQSLMPHQPVAQAMTRMIPNAATPAQIPPAMMFFMAAIAIGDLPGWLGDKAANALRREGVRGAEILSRLGRDFSGLSRLAAGDGEQVLSQDWKGAAIPMMWQDEISKIHLYYRHQYAEKEDNKENPDGRSTRFLFDFHLDKIGDIQLDGYMKDKRLDLIIRTKTLFSPQMQGKMRVLYQSMLEQGGLDGELGFQNRADQWVHVDIRQSSIKTSV